MKENQTEKKIDDEMETGIIQLLGMHTTKHLQ